MKKISQKHTTFSKIKKIISTRIKIKHIAKYLLLGLATEGIFVGFFWGYAFVTLPHVYPYVYSFDVLPQILLFSTAFCIPPALLFSLYWYIGSAYYRLSSKKFFRTSVAISFITFLPFLFALFSTKINNSTFFFYPLGFSLGAIFSFIPYAYMIVVLCAIFFAVITTIFLLHEKRVRYIGLPVIFFITTILCIYTLTPKFSIPPQNMITYHWVSKPTNIFEKNTIALMELWNIWDFSGEYKPLGWLDNTHAVYQQYKHIGKNQTYIYDLQTKKATPISKLEKNLYVKNCNTKHVPDRFSLSKDCLMQDGSNFLISDKALLSPNKKWLLIEIQYVEQPHELLIIKRGK